MKRAAKLALNAIIGLLLARACEVVALLVYGGWIR